MMYMEVKTIMNAKEECGQLTKDASKAVGRGMFVSFFDYSNPDNASQLVGDWISRNTGPLWWFRSMLVEVGMEDLGTARRILAYLCKPFGLIPVQLRDGEAPKKLIRLEAAQDIMAAVVRVIQEITQPTAIPRKIEQACDEGIAQLLSLKCYVKNIER